MEDGRAAREWQCCLITPTCCSEAVCRPSLPLPLMHRPPTNHHLHHPCIHTHTAMSSKHDKKKGKHQASGTGGVSALLDVFSSSSHATMAAKTAEWESKGDAGVVGDDVRRVIKRGMNGVWRVVLVNGSGVEFECWVSLLSSTHVFWCCL